MINIFITTDHKNTKTPLKNRKVDCDDPQPLLLAMEMVREYIVHFRGERPLTTNLIKMEKKKLKRLF